MSEEEIETARDETEMVRAYFEQRGHPADAEHMADEEEAEEQAAAPAAEADPQEEPQEDREGQEDAEGEEDKNIPRVAWENRQLKRKMQSLEAERNRATEVLQQILNEQQRQAALAQQQYQQQQAPQRDEVPDRLLDPEGYAEWEEANRFGPVRQRIENLERLLMMERQQQAAQQQWAQHNSELASSEQEWESANPGYFDRAKAWMEGVYTDQVEAGYSPEQAQQLVYAALNQIRVMAANNGKHPAEVVEIFARRYGGQQAAPRPQPTDRLEQARAAGATMALSGRTTGEGIPTAEDIVTANVTDDQIRNVFNQGGFTAFKSMMREADKASRRAG